jgi:hypothetical protein
MSHVLRMSVTFRNQKDSQDPFDVFNYRYDDAPLQKLVDRCDGFFFSCFDIAQIVREKIPAAVVLLLK